MATFVKFPGTAGNYVFTDDVNLLDADTAHIVQSIGQWGIWANSAGFAVQADTSSPFGGSSLRWVPQNTAAQNSEVSLRDQIRPTVSPSTQYSMGCWAKSANRTLDLNITAVDYDSGGAQGSVSAGTVVSAEAGVWTWCEVTHTTASDAATITPIVKFQAADLDLDVFQVASVVLRTGSDASFVPSLRIVGDLFEDIDPPDMPIVFAGDGTPLTVGEGWAGNGYYYRRYDGASNLAPLVAQFDADDVPVAAQLPSP